MKILALNGSPVKNGTVAKVMKEIIIGIGDAASTEWINVYDLDMRPCIGCMKCRTTGTCALPADDAHSIGEKIRIAQGLIIGTPTHWGNMSSPLKLLLDRNVPVFMGQKANGIPMPLQKGKPAIIATACATPWPFNFIAPESRGAINAIRHVLKYGGYRILGTIVKPHTKKYPAIPSRLNKQAQRLGAKLAQALP